MNNYHDFIKDFTLLDKIGFFVFWGMVVLAVIHVLEVLFNLFVSFCEAVIHRIKYGPGVVLPEEPQDGEE